MTAPPSPPIRRRRKLIVAFVVLVSLVVASWNWPRGDARFVGKWRADSANRRIREITINERGGCHRSGVTGPVVFESTCWVVGNRLNIGANPLVAFNASRRAGVFQALRAAISAATGNWINEEYQFEFRGPDEVVLTDVDGRSITLTRIPE